MCQLICLWAYAKSYNLEHPAYVHSNIALLYYVVYKCASIHCLRPISICVEDAPIYNTEKV